MKFVASHWRWHLVGFFKFNGWRSMRARCLSMVTTNNNIRTSDWIKWSELSNKKSSYNYFDTSRYFETFSDSYRFSASVLSLFRYRLYYDTYESMVIFSWARQSSYNLGSSNNNCTSYWKYTKSSLYFEKLSSKFNNGSKRPWKSTLYKIFELLHLRIT